MADRPATTATMPAAVYRGPGDVAIEARPVPQAGPGELVIEVEQCGVCGSDIHMMIEGWGRPGSIEGHEYSGRVVQVAEGVEGWDVGDPVVGGPAPRCGRCRHCLAGRPSLCDERDTPGTTAWQGAFARYKSLPAAQAVRVPDGMALRVAALAEPLAVALHGLTRARVEPGQRVMVFGAGPIGSLTVAALRQRGVDDITVCEPNMGRRHLAKRVGARSVVEPSDLEIPTIAEPGRIVDGAADLVLECSGNAQAMEAGLAQLARGGRMVLVGAGMRQPRFDPNRILLNELEVSGAFCYDPGGFDAALEMLGSQRFPVDALIDPTGFALRDLAATLQRIASGEIAAKAMIDPREEPPDG